MKIAILGGAGLMGAGIVRDLISDRAIVPIDDDPHRRRVATAHRCADRELADPRLEAFDLDVSDPQQLAAAVSGVDIVINAVPTLLGHQMAIFEACLAAGVAYTDLGGLGTYTVKQKAMHERFRAGGVAAVIGTGSDPGMSNVICRAVADELDTIDRINLYWAAEFVGAGEPGAGAALLDLHRARRIRPTEHAVPRWPPPGMRADDRPRDDRSAGAVGTLRVHVLAAFRAAHRAARRRHSRRRASASSPGSFTCRIASTKPGSGW